MHGTKTVLPKSAQRNIQNWKNGKLPDANKDVDRIEAIFHEFFGTDKNLQHWKFDLEEALKKDRQKQTARIAKREIFDPCEIPRPTAHFMGRDEIVNTLGKTLASPQGSRAILIQGGPGIGKTELTKAIAHHDEMAKRFGARRWLVRLENADVAEEIEGAIIKALGCDLKSSFQDALNILRDKQCLLILDNLETPWETSEETDGAYSTDAASRLASPEQAHIKQMAVAEILAELFAIPGVTLLGSIRGVQLVDGVRWEVQPLDSLSPSDAASLFASISKLDADDPHFGDFMRVLGGLPLAVSLVAHRAHGCTGLAPLWKEWQRIGTEFAKRPGSHTGPLTSLHWSIELSLAFCKDDAAALHLFSLLGCLPAGLAREDLEALLGNDAYEAEERLRKVGLTIEREGRIDLLPPVRVHATLYHPPADNNNEMWSSYYIKRFKELSAPPAFSLHDVVSTFLHSDIDNIESAFKTKLEMGKLTDALDALEGFGGLWCGSGKLLNVVEKVSAMCRSEENLKGTADCLRAKADLKFVMYDMDSDIIGLYREALEVYDSIGDHEGRAFCKIRLSFFAFCRDEYRDAEESFSELIHVYKELNQKYFAAYCAETIGIIKLHEGNITESEFHFEYALILYEEIKCHRGESYCLLNLSDINIQRGNSVIALSLCVRAIEILINTSYREKTQNPLDFEFYQLGIQLEKGSKIAHDCGDYTASQRAIDYAIALYESRGHSKNYRLLGRPWLSSEPVTLQQVFE